MGKGNYLGGGSLLNIEAGFKSYDPAEKQRRTYVSSGPAYSPVRPSLEYTIQVQEQIRILLRHIANGKKKPYIPQFLKEEISEFGSLFEWARAKPEYEEIIKERRSGSIITDRAKKAPGRKPKAKKGSIGRMEPPEKAAAEKRSGVAEEQIRSPADVLADLEAVLE